jgi:hypothetical protein
VDGNADGDELFDHFGLTSSAHCSLEQVQSGSGFIRHLHIDESRSLLRRIPPSGRLSGHGTPSTFKGFTILPEAAADAARPAPGYCA